MKDKINFSRLEKEIDLFKNNLEGLGLESNQLILVISVVIPYFEQLIKLVQPADFTELQLNQLKGIIEKISNHINNCNALFVSNNETGLSFWDKVNRELSEILNLYNTNRSDLDGFLSLAIGNSITANQNRLDWEIQNIKRSINSYETSTNESIEALKTLAEDITVPKYAEVYMDAKVEYDKMAKSWLRTGVGVILVLVGIIIWVLKYVSIPSYSTVDNPFVFILTNFSLRFTLIGIFLYLLYFVSHKYNVAKHNATVYGSKAAALKTFLAFIKTTSDNEVKNAMLMAITDFIFKDNSTGYLESDKAVGNIDSNYTVKLLSKLIDKAK